MSGSCIILSLVVCDFKVCLRLYQLITTGAIKSMEFITGSSKSSWQPVVTTNTTTPGYWLNWRVLICAIWVLSSLVLTFYIILKYEGPKNSRNGRRETEEEEEPAGVVYEDELWKPSLRGIHPAWLLGYRLVVFFVLLIMLSLNVAVDGGSIFDYYTQ